MSDDERIVADCERISISVLHVKFEKADTNKLKARMEEIIAVRPTYERRELRKIRDAIMDSEYETTTGFVISEDQDAIFILTCAHSFQLCFDGSSTITVDQLNIFYTISVHCDHNELHHRLNNQIPRAYNQARAVHLDSRKDILVLRVNRGFCNENHPPLQLAQMLPGRCLGRVGMVSWPFDRHRTTCTGHMSHNDRKVADITDFNIHGYNFSALEVNISTESGSSGVALVDLEGDVLGLLHGGRGHCISYFVSLGDLRDSLTDWGKNVSKHF